jgi:hypothetical protein
MNAILVVTFALLGWIALDLLVVALLVWARPARLSAPGRHGREGARSSDAARPRLLRIR